MFHIKYVRIKIVQLIAFLSALPNPATAQGQILQPGQIAQAQISQTSFIGNQGYGTNVVNPSIGGYGSNNIVNPIGGGYGTNVVNPSIGGGYGTNVVNPSIGGGYGTNVIQPGIGGYGTNTGGYGTNVIQGQEPDCDYDKTCFLGRANCAIAKANPFQRTIVTSCEECVNLCRDRVRVNDQYKCKAVMFDTAYNSCDLFAVNQTDGYPLVRYQNRDLYIVNEGRCGGTTDGVDPLATCPAGQVPRYLEITDASQDFAGDSTSFAANSVDQCIDACNNNKDPSGNSISCRAVAYDGRNCIVALDVIEPRGPAVLINAPGTTYLEKYCFPESVVQNCADTFERWPQYSLSGFADTVINTDSFDECLTECIRYQETSGQPCLSGMYYYDATADEGNCILNLESKDTQPNLFGIDPQGDIVDYFQPDCGFRALQAARSRFAKARQQKPKARASFKRPLESSAKKRIEFINKASPSTKLGEWTKWSRCNLRRDEQVRFRKCESIDIRECDQETKPCEKFEAIFKDTNPLPLIDNEPTKFESLSSTGNASREFSPANSPGVSRSQKLPKLPPTIRRHQQSQVVRSRFRQLSIKAPISETSS